MNKEQSVGQKVADHIALFTGSWAFIGSLATIVTLWIIVNQFVLDEGFDAYPFILLNLGLSLLATLQVPMIMMAQNKMDKRDRERAERDLKVNEQSKKDIEYLNRKMDDLMNHVGCPKEN